MNLFKLLSNSADAQTEARIQAYREIIRKEAKIGGELFGPVNPGGRREFFCLDPNTWVWHEEWVDAQGLRHSITTRYDVRSNGVLKAQDGLPYQFVGFDEAKRLYQAVKLYNKHVDMQLYGLAA